MRQHKDCMHSIKKNRSVQEKGKKKKLSAGEIRSLGPAVLSCAVLCCRAAAAGNRGAQRLRERLGPGVHLRLRALLGAGGADRGCSPPRALGAGQG